MTTCIFFLNINQEEFEDTKETIRIRKEQTTQKKKSKKDKQRSTKHSYQTKDRGTRTPLKTGSEPKCNLFSNPINDSSE